MTSLLSRNIPRILPRIHSLALLGPGRGRLTGQPGGRILTAAQPRLYSASAQAQSLIEEDVRVAAKAKKSQDDLEKLLSVLDTSCRKQGRVLERDMARVLNIIENTGVCPASQALLLVKCCGNVLVDVERKKRTELVSRCFSLFESIPSSKLDISHYNALLKVHQENQNNINIPEFMASLEQKNIAPNRVTFQHIVALYCQAGDIAGATTILHHMKNNDMAINESVLLSLLSAHCAKNDQDSVTSTLDLITNSGITLGVDVHTTMAVSYARSGNWAKVEETLEQAVSNNVMFDDSHIFSIMKACVDGDLVQESFSLIEKLPRKRGFFQELRNAIPHLAKSGNIPLLMDLAFRKEDRSSFDKSSQGAHLTSYIIKSGAEVPEIVAAILKLEESGYTLAIQQMLQEASYNWPADQCTVLKTELDRALGERKPAMHVGKSYNFITDVFETDKDPEKILKCLRNFAICGVPVSQDFVALELLPVMLDQNLSRSRDVVSKIRDSCPKVAFSQLGNSVLKHLLNKTLETSEVFNLAVEFFLYNNIVYSKANTWNSSLSRAYLRTRDVENMTTMIFLGQRKKVLWDNDPLVALNQLFKSLTYVQKQAQIFQPGVSSDDLVAPVIEDLIKNNIGIPRNVNCFKNIQENIQSDEVKELLEKATNVWDNSEAYWTDDHLASFIAARKKLLRSKMGSTESQKTDIKEQTIPSLRRRYNGLQTKGLFDFNVSDQLIVQYLESKDLDEAKNVMNHSRSSGKFSLSHKALEMFVTELVNLSKCDEAGQLIIDEMEIDGERRVGGNSLVVCLLGLAEQGDHKAVMDLLQKIDKARLFGKPNLSRDLLDFYVKKGDGARLHEMFEYLQSVDLASSDHLNALVDIHLERNDLTAATEEFFRIAKVYKKLPKKFVLTCRLIEEENVEAIQKVTDVSADLLDESRALYDLAHCFLQMNQAPKARQLLDSPGLPYLRDRVDYIYDKLDVRNKNACEDFVAVTKNIFGCDRDSLYGKLVRTKKNDPDKVEDIWVLIQEEGHVPSDELKIQIANVLNKHGRTVPFEKPEETSAATEEESSIIIDADIYLALRNKKDRNALKMTLASFDSNKRSSLKCKREVLEWLIRGNKLDGASELAAKIAHSFDDPLQINFLRVFYKIRDRLGEDKGEQFFNSLPQKLSTHLRENLRGSESNTNNQEVDDESGSTGEKSLIARRTSLNKLLEDNDLEEASKAVIDICENDNVKQLAQIVRQAGVLITKLEKANKVDEMKWMFDCLGVECRKVLKTEYRYKTAMIRNNPERYIEEVTQDGQDLRKLVSTEVLNGAIRRNPSFSSSLETLATSGNISAVILMTKLSLYQNDQEKLLKYYHSCPSNIEGNYLFDKIDSEEKFNMCLGLIDGNKNHLSAIFNRYLYNCKKSENYDVSQFANIANNGVERGMEVKDFSASFLQVLAESQNFKLQQEAKASLKK